MCCMCCSKRVECPMHKEERSGFIGICGKNWERFCRSSRGFRIRGFRDEGDIDVMELKKLPGRAAVVAGRMERSDWSAVVGNQPLLWQLLYDSCPGGGVVDSLSSIVKACNTCEYAIPPSLPHLPLLTPARRPVLLLGRRRQRFHTRSTSLAWTRWCASRFATTT